MLFLNDYPTYKSCIHSRESVSSTIISPTSRWKKVSSKCCLTVLDGINNFIVNTPTDLTGYFRICSAMTIFGMQIGLGIGSVLISIIMVPIENRSNFMATITSFLSLNILKWKL